MRRTSRKLARRTSRSPGTRLRSNRRRTSRNPRTPPQYDPYDSRSFSKYLHWVYRTYADGTPVKFREPYTGWSHGQMVKIKPGAKAIMGPWEQETPFEPHVEVIPSQYVYPSGAYINLDLRETAIEEILEPLEDNWASSGMPIGRHRLPRSQRSWMKPNPAPPMPQRPPGAGWYDQTDTYRRKIRDWMDKTYPPGTPIATMEDATYLGGLEIPAGARGVVLPHIPGNQDIDPERVWVQITDARDAAGIPIDRAIGERVGMSGARMRPLVDHWAKPGRRTSRHHLPKSQRSWLKPNVPVDQLRVPKPDESTTSVRDYVEWLYTTYAPGTPVKLIGTEESLLSAPVGSRAVVKKIEGLGSVWVQFTDARDEIGFPIHYIIGGRGVTAQAPTMLEPLEDNWVEKFRSAPTGRHRLPASQRARLAGNPRDRLDIEVGDIVEMERHPIYQSSGATKYRVTKRKVKSVKWFESDSAVVTFVGMKSRYAGGVVVDKSFRLGGSEKRGWWLTSDKPGPARYEIVSVIKKRKR